MDISIIVPLFNEAESLTPLYEWIERVMKAHQFSYGVVTLTIPYLVYRLTVDCRDRVSGGVISYGAALWYGIQLFFYAALISAVFKFIYIKFLNLDYLPYLVNESLIILDKLNMLSGDYGEEQVRQLYTPLYVTMQSIWSNVFVGVFVSLVTAAFAKKDKSIFDTDVPQTNNQ